MIRCETCLTRWVHIICVRRPSEIQFLWWDVCFFFTSQPWRCWHEGAWCYRDRRPGVGSMGLHSVFFVHLFPHVDRQWCHTCESSKEWAEYPQMYHTPVNWHGWLENQQFNGRLHLPKWVHFSSQSCPVFWGWYQPETDFLGPWNHFFSCAEVLIYWWVVVIFGVQNKSWSRLLGLLEMGCRVWKIGLLPYFFFGGEANQLDLWVSKWNTLK